MSVKSGFFYTILPQSRVGKSVLVGSILTQAYLQETETPAVIRGYLKPDAPSTFSDCTEFMQGQNFCLMKQKIGFIFVFECREIMRVLSAGEVNTILEKLEAGLKELPYTEQITFAPEVNSFDSERQHQIASQDKVS
ncbi:MAG: hypothetical protein KME05_06455 [Gloeocapsa sp. UFS-A4-WI-NPMV-4B04]|nr:hypothetical protein [Gloeocapsa sp. UFS-A4-WI-NPMV-4B04]